MSATGTIDLKGQGLPSDLTIKLDNAVYIDGTLVTATVNGTMGLKGPLMDGPTLSGKLTLDKTSITIPSRLPGSIAQLDIKHKNAPADVRRQTAILNPEKTGMAATRRFCSTCKSRLPRKSSCADAGSTQN